MPEATEWGSIIWEAVVIVGGLIVLAFLLFVAAAVAMGIHGSIKAGFNQGKRRKDDDHDGLR